MAVFQKIELHLCSLVILTQSLLWSSAMKDFGGPGEKEKPKLYTQPPKIFPRQNFLQFRLVITTGDDKGAHDLSSLLPTDCGGTVWYLVLPYYCVLYRWSSSYG